VLGCVSNGSSSKERVAQRGEPKRLERTPNLAPVLQNVGFDRISTAGDTSCDRPGD
jgi:hypothetical protein